MPTPEDDLRYDKAVVWMANGLDVDGRRRVDQPVELRVRWNANSHEGTDSEGNLVRMDGAMTVRQDVPVGSLVWLGALDDLPSPLVDLKRVADFGSGPDLKRRYYRRVCHLTRYGDALPTVNT